MSFSLRVPLTARRVAGGSSRSMRVPVMMMSHSWSTSGEGWQRDTEHQHDPESATTATVGSNSYRHQNVQNCGTFVCRRSVPCCRPRARITGVGRQGVVGQEVSWLGQGALGPPPRCVKATNRSSVLNNRCWRHMFSVSGPLSA